MATAKQNFYKWHRIIGLTALIPVISWTLSGLSHPFMSNWFRPTIAREVFKPAPMHEMNIALSLQQVLDKNNVKELRNFGLAHFNHQTYYQVMGKDSIISYFNANNGTVLPKGDQLYATFLARYFTQDSTSKIKSIILQKKFDAGYQPINHLLPVWKVSFDRPDGMDVYVETTQSRMGTFNNNTRKVMLKVFEQMHTWDFLAALGGEQFRIVVLLAIVAVMFLALLTGLTVYGFFWKQFKAAADKQKQSGRDDRRFVHRFHRQLGLIVSFVMFTFLISGAFHLAIKLHNSGATVKGYSKLISRDSLNLSSLQIPVTDSTVRKLGLVTYQGKCYYQVSNSNKEILYFNAGNGEELLNGDVLYARSLANFYNGSHLPNGSKANVIQIRQFDNEYGFINKRLPVQKVSYPDGDNWYIETTTSQLATKVAGIDRTEGFSFIFLHKYFGMTWAGKNVRDIVSMLAALGVLVVSLFGFAAFIKNK